MFIAGDHVPVIPLVDVVGSGANVDPLQIVSTNTNVGVTVGVTVIVIVEVVAHCPAAGVNVYVVVAILLIAGDQVPVTPLVDVVGKVANTTPLQIGDTDANAGLTGVEITVIVPVALPVPQPPVKGMV